MTQIIGFSGRSQSGKNACCNFILGTCLQSLGLVRKGFSINEKGQLYVKDILGDEKHAGIFDYTNQNENFKKFSRENIDPYVKIYSVAQFLKTDICVNILGLKYELIYGSDEDKNTVSHLRWEDMPGVVPMHCNWNSENLVRHDPGFMTYREVMQYVGTSIFRKMYSKVWADAIIKQIQRDKSQLALICDIRFADELFNSKECGGINIRLTRNPINSKHSSETALDKDVFDWNNFDYVIDNAELSIPDQNLAIYHILQDIGLIEKEINSENRST